MISPLPQEDEQRKRIKLSVIWKFWPDATIALVEKIMEGQDKYCRDLEEPFWDRSKSPEEVESLLRHEFEKVVCGHQMTAKEEISHASAALFRAYADLQKIIEKHKG